MRIISFFATLFIAGLAVIFTTGTLNAGTGDPLADAPVIKHQRMYRKARHEISPLFGLTFNDHFRKSFLNGVGYTYHISDWFGVGASAMYGLSWNTSLTEQMEAEYAKTNVSFQLSTSMIG